MISVLMTMFLACGDKEEEDTAAAEEVVDEVRQWLDHGK